MSRLDDIRDELLEHQRFIAEHSGIDHAANRLVMNQTRRRIAELEDKLQMIALRPLEMRLVGSIAENHAVPAAFLSQIILRFQTFVTWSTWALRSGPGVGGTVPAGVERSSQAEVFAFAPGSFKFGIRRIRHDDLGQEEFAPGDLFDKAIDSFLTMIDAAESEEDLDATAEGVIQTLGQGAARRLQLLALKLKSGDAGLDVVQEGPERRRATLDSEGVSRLCAWLAAYEESYQEISVTGVLRVLDTVRGRFGIEDAAEHLYEGKAPPQLLTGANVQGLRYVARIRQTVNRSDHTGIEREHLVLVDLEPFNES